jgi:VanZ family protein
MRRALWLWLPVAGCLALSFYLSSLPGADLADPFPDYVAHGLEFFALGTLMVRALNGGMARAPAARTYAVAVLLCLAWALLDEYHQSFVAGRDSSWVDVGSDLLGATIAAAVFRWVRRGAPAWV